MISFNKISDDKPYLVFKDNYNKALKKQQKNIEAVAISSYDIIKEEVNSRFVNLKYIENNKWTFFSNYNSPKSIEFAKHSQISAIFYWNEINIQIRIKANIQKLSSEDSDTHFNNRDVAKNALAISSNQSQKTHTYELITKKYTKELKLGNIKKRPEYWGGYFFIPFYFEFWEGHPARLNKRDSFELKNGKWTSYVLQP